MYCGSVSGHVYAVDGRTGQELWAAQVAQSATARIGVYNPVLREGIVYVGYTADEAVGRYGGAAAVDAADGRVVWVTPFPTPDPGNVSAAYSGVVVTDRHVVAPSGDGTLVVLTRATGAVERVLPRSLLDPLPPEPGAAVRMHYADHADIIMTSNRGHVTVLRPNDLTVRWRANFSLGSPTAVTADSDYVFLTYAGGQVASARRSDGELRWILEKGDFRADRLENIIAAPAIDGSVLYLGGGQEVYAMRRH